MRLPRREKVVGEPRKIQMQSSLRIRRMVRRYMIHRKH